MRDIPYLGVKNKFYVLFFSLLSYKKRMSNNNQLEARPKKRSITSDPYAGQYPPPPPLPVQDLAVEENQQYYPQPQRQELQELEQDHEPFYVIDQSSSRRQHSSFSSSQNQQSFHDDNRSAAPTTSSSYHSMPEPGRGHYYENTNSSHNNETEDAEYYDPEAVDLREYLQAERQEKLRQQQELDQRVHDMQLQLQQQQQQQQQPYASNSSEAALVDMEDAYRHQHPLPRPEPVFYNTQPMFNEEQALYNNNNGIASPMMMPRPLFKPTPSMFTPPPQQPQFLSPFGQPLLVQQGSNPSMMPPHPMMPPLLPPPPPPSQFMMDDKFSTERRDGCCCFGISFCSCLWTIVLLVFLGAGIALIVASKIVQDKCTSSEGYRETNVTLCGQVLHDGFLYGGIAIAGLSALIVIWRLVRWTCR
jgi:hypothetical protein